MESRLAHAGGGTGAFSSPTLSFSPSAENLSVPLVLGKVLGGGISQVWLLPSLLPVFSRQKEIFHWKVFSCSLPQSLNMEWEGQTVSRAESSSESSCWVQVMKMMVPAPEAVPRQGTKQGGREGDGSMDLPHSVTCWNHLKGI